MSLFVTNYKKNVARVTYLMEKKKIPSIKQLFEKSLQVKQTDK